MAQILPRNPSSLAETKDRVEEPPTAIVNVVVKNGVTNVQLTLPNKTILVIVFGIAVFSFPNLWNYLDVLLTLLTMR